VSRLGRLLRAEVTFDRVAIAILAVGAIVLVASLAGGSEDGHTDEAVRLVPRGALFYAHATIEPNSDEWRLAGEIVRELPTLRRLRDRALRSLSRGDRPLDFDRSVRPWIGDEAALALLPDGGRASSLILVRVADQARAREFLRGAGRPREQRHRGVTVRSYGNLATAFVDDFLAVGTAAHVRAAIDTRGRRSLRDDPVFGAAVERLEVDDPLAYAYASRTGVSRVLRGQGGLVAQAGGLLERPGLRGAAAAVRAETNGVRASVARITVPAAADVRGFEPTLLSEVPAGTIAYVGARGLDSIFRLLEDFGAAASVERVLGRRVGAAAERSLLDAVKPLLDREAALVVTPPASLPVITLVVANTSREEGGNVLVALQPLLSRLLQAPSGAGQVPTLQPRQIAGVEAVTLRVSPTLELTYAAFDDKLVVSTSPEGVGQMRGRGSALEDNASFAPGLRDFLQRPSSVVFLDLRRLSALADRAGLGDTPDYRAIRPDIARVGAVSAVTASKRSAQTAEIFLEVP
jgi:Protein of unknown function (DUF3352)